jgi:hypothetical protein
MARRERSGRAAFAGLALLVVNWGCDDARPKVQATAPTAAATSTASVAATVNTAAKLDPTPRATAPEKRLRQQQVGRDLVIDSKGPWPSHCLIHRACKVKARDLDLCPPGSDAPLWSTLPGKAEHFTDPLVAIKGQLVLTDGWFSTAASCGKGHCCNRLAVDIVLAGPPYDLELVGLRCGGDESRQCCPFSARGEEVIASGILKYGSGRLYLTSPKLCRTKND